MKPQLTLRDWFWLSLVAGIGLGWWVDRATLVKVQNEILSDRDAVIQKLGKERDELSRELNMSRFMQHGIP